MSTPGACTERFLVSYLGTVSILFQRCLKCPMYIFGISSRFLHVRSLVDENQHRPPDAVLSKSIGKRWATVYFFRHVLCSDWYREGGGQFLLYSFQFPELCPPTAYLLAPFRKYLKEVCYRIWGINFETFRIFDFFQISINSLTSDQRNFVLSETIFSASGSFDWGPNLKILHAEKIELWKSFPKVPNMKGLAIAKAEIIQFIVGALKNRKNAIF